MSDGGLAVTTACASAFGLKVTSRFPITGLEPREGRRAFGEVEIDSDGPAEDWGIEPTMVRRGERGRLLATCHEHPLFGHRMYASGFGTFDIAADGRRIICRPEPSAPEWLWQRFLLGQALAFAAVAQGLETFHAAAVEVDGRAVVIAGGSGAGKSTLSLNLAVRGMSLCTDDVVTIAPNGTTVLPGPAIANVRDAALRRLAADGERPFREIIGESAESARVTIDSAASDLPLGAVYFVDRSAAHAGMAIRECSDPFRLIGHTFNILVDSRARLARQLDTCARIARNAGLFELQVPVGVSGVRTSDALLAHARNHLTG